MYIALVKKLLDNNSLVFNYEKSCYFCLSIYLRYTIDMGNCVSKNIITTNSYKFVLTKGLLYTISRSL